MTSVPTSCTFSRLQPPPSIFLVQVFFNGANVKQVDVPTLTGAFGILPAHVPTLQVLRPGVVTVFSDDGAAAKYFGEILFNLLFCDVRDLVCMATATRHTCVVFEGRSFSSALSIFPHY